LLEVSLLGPHHLNIQLVILSFVTPQLFLILFQKFPV
jgi:hypothetical protein